MEKLAAYVVREGALSAEDALGWIVRLCTTLEPIHARGTAHGRISAKAIHIHRAECVSAAYLLDSADLVDEASHFSVERTFGSPKSASDDCWAVGVTLYAMLTGVLPYPGGTADAVRKRLLGPPPSPLAVYDVGDDHIQSVLDRVLAREYAKRLTSVTELRTLLVEQRPRLKLLPSLYYGRPEDIIHDEDSSGDIVTTSIYDTHGSGSVAEAIREAQRRLQGASVATATSVPATPLRSVRPPKAPGARSAPPPPMPPPVQRAAAPPPREPPAAAYRREDQPLIETESLDVIMDPVSAIDLLDGGGHPHRGDTPHPGAARPRLADPTTPDPVGAAIVPVLIPPSPPPRPPAAPPPEDEPSWFPDLKGSAPAGTPRTPGPAGTPRTPGPAGTPRTPGPVMAAPPARPFEGRRASPTRPSPVPPPPIPVPVARAMPDGEPNGEEIRDPSSAQAHVASIEPAPWRGAGAVPYVLGAICILAGAFVAYSLLRKDTNVRPTPAASAASSTTVGPSASSAPVPSAGPSRPPPSRPANLVECVLPLFPTDTFSGRVPDVEFICSIEDPLQGTRQLRSQVVLAGGGDRGVTAGMRELNTMGWYALAAYAMARGRCCTEPPPFKTPTTLSSCQLDPRLERLSAAANAPDNPAATAALTEVTEAFNCLARGGSAAFFGQTGMPQGGELTVFMQTFDRARALTRK